MPDLFDTPPVKPGDSYSAKDIEVLEGLEPVRRRPGMYVGGADERGLLPGNTEHQPRGPRAGAQPARHDGALPSRPGDFRRAGLPAGDALPDGALQGVSLPGPRNSLELPPLRAASGRRPGRGAAS